MVVESEEMDAPGSDIGQGGFEGFEVVFLPAQVNAHVGRPGAGVERREQVAPGF